MSEMKSYPPIPSLKPAFILSEPKDAKYQKENRLWQGCPSIAKTKGGRLWACWFSGGIKEPGYDNFNMVWYSDDDGKTWRENYIVVEADEKGNYDRATDINLWIAPDGALYVTYVQMRIADVMLPRDQIWCFYDHIFGTWFIKCDDPDAENPVFSEPVRWCDGYTRNQPTVLKNGDWFLPAYDWTLPVFITSDTFLGRGKGTYYHYFRLSHDEGKTWELVQGPVKERLHTFDEGMMVEGLDGAWHVWVREGIYNGMGHSVSYDKGQTWSEMESSEFNTGDARFYIRRLASGNVLIVHSGPNRKGMYARLSFDDCKTWSEPLILDDRAQVSYPDGMQYEDGSIYIAYDRERYGAREILYARFTEDDVKARELVSDGSFTGRIINKLTTVRPE